MSRAGPDGSPWSAYESVSPEARETSGIRRTVRKPTLQVSSGAWHRGPNLVISIEHLTIQRMEHVGIVVDDLAAATEFFVELGLVLQGEGPVEGRWVDRVVGLDGVRADIAMMQTPDGNGRLELTKFHSPSNQGDNRHAPANTPG